MQALRAAAADGVDVRLLVPGGSDMPLVRLAVARRLPGLLEAGVRVFEWNGSMVHAKTAVADGLWARVGSTNLNIQSWMGNWELDVAVEDAGFGAAMERMFEADLDRATEVLLTARGRTRTAVEAAGAVATSSAPRRPWTRRRRRGGGSTSRAAAGAFRFGNTWAPRSRRPASWVRRRPGRWRPAARCCSPWGRWRPGSRRLSPIRSRVGATWLGLSLAGAAWRARRPR